MHLYHFLITYMVSRHPRLPFFRAFCSLGIRSACSVWCLSRTFNAEGVEAASDWSVLAGPTSTSLLRMRTVLLPTNRAGKSPSPSTSSNTMLLAVSHAHGKALYQKAAKPSSPGAFQFGCLKTAVHHAWFLLGRLMSLHSTFS